MGYPLSHLLLLKGAARAGEVGLAYGGWHLGSPRVQTHDWRDLASLPGCMTILAPAHLMVRTVIYDL